eukprot:13865693-Ditylum_brightwellii.AAC.1
MTPLEFIEDAEKEYRLYYCHEKWTAAKHDPEGHRSYKCSKPSTGNKFAPSGWKPGGGRGC